MKSAKTVQESSERTRERQKEARRSAIIDAAVDTFAKKGFHDTNVSEIAARAGVSQGTIYLYYESKHELFRAVELRLFEKLAHPMLELLDKKRWSASRRLREVAKQALDSFVHHQELVYLLFQVISTKELARTLARDFVEQYREFKGALVPLFEDLGDPEPAAAASSYMAILDGLALQAMLGPDIFHPSSALEQIERRFALNED